jgi:phage gpG-like protein
MAGLEDMVTASQIAATIDSLRFDKRITGFEFKPSLGIVAKRMSVLAAELEDLHEPLTRAISQVMTVSILENFVSGGRPSWEPLAPTTLSRREREGTGDMILVQTSSLADVASSESVWSVGKTSATIKDLPEKVWYGKVHQGGSGEIPARPFAVFQDEDIDAIEIIFAEWIEEKVREAGF